MELQKGHICATYLKSVGAGHLLLRNNSLGHHAEWRAHRGWVRPQDCGHHRPWGEVWVDTNLRHPSQVRVCGLLMNTAKQVWLVTKQHSENTSISKHF